MQNDPLSAWKLRIRRAQAASKGLMVETFQPTLSDQTYRVHAGEPVEIIDIIIDPTAEPELYDEETLPFFKGRFRDGTELALSAEELVTSTPALRELISAVCSGFALARDMGYVGPLHLSEEGSDQELEDFERSVVTFNPA